MLLTIEKIKKIITPICIKYGVDRLYLFGSYARQEATASSDIDFRIEKGSIQDLFALSAFRIDLVEALGIEVDIVSAAPISPNEILLFQSSHGQDNFFKAHRKEVYALAKKIRKRITVVKQLSPVMILVLKMIAGNPNLRRIKRSDNHGRFTWRSGSLFKKINAAASNER